jgi:uncharacterized membrane protein
MWLLRYNILEILTRTARDVHPPGYYLIAKPWVMVFGDSVFSIRFLSLIFSVGIIFLTYKIIEILFSKKAAFWSALFVAFSPFMIRFGQEARMYGVVAFFTTLAVYCFVLWLKNKKDIYLVGFVPAMLIAMYTQYYSFFAIISLWIILALYTPELWQFKWLKGFKERSGVFSWKWWFANLSLLVLYIPWFMVAYKQVTRVSDSYWIKPEWITIKTIPGSVSQFITYSHLDGILEWGGFLGNSVYWLIMLVLIFSGVFLFYAKDKKKAVISLIVFGYLPMLLVFVVSKLRTPIYQDRYFPFSAIAIFAIWGSAVSLIKNKTTRITVGSMVLVLMLLGIIIMRHDVNHKMRDLTEEVKNHSTTSDVLLSESLYTFLDSSYYLGYGNIRFLSEPVDGYGESSLFYDQQDNFVVGLEELNNLGDRVWVIGRDSENYIDKNASNDWNKELVIQKDSLRAVLYTR